MACLAYDLTGDRTYAVACKHALEKAFLDRVESLRRYENLNFGDIGLGSTVPRLMRVVADALDRDPDAFAEAEAQWETKRREIEEKPDPERPDRDPGTSLGVLSTDPLPVA